MDDYITLEKGTTGSIFESSKAMTAGHYSGQGRYQPVRMSVFAFFTRIFEEEYSPYYNLGLHLINLILMLLLLRKFNVNNISILITVLLFSLFGRHRMMESPSAMIGGSGLNLFFFLLTLLFLIRSFEEPAKRIVYLSISWTAYACLIFSYEVAFPLFLPVVCVFFLFNGKAGAHNPSGIKKYLYLLPYLVPPLVYLIFFKLPAQNSFAGSTISLSTEILTRLGAYINYTMHFPIKFRIRAESAAVLMLYFIALVISFRIDRAAGAFFNQTRDNLKALMFGIIFYLSSMVLFTLNKWETPSSVMRHHTYLMTAGSSMVIVFALSGMHLFFKGQVKKWYQYFLILCLFPVCLVSGTNFNLMHYEKEFERTSAIKLMKYEMQSSIKGPEETDAIIVKNFFQPYYGISGMSGSFLQWFHFRKYIYAGREIISVKNNNIKFKGPLTYYHPPNREYEVQNKRSEIYYLNEADKRLLSYHNFIDFDEGRNIHQTAQVREDGFRNGDEDYVLDAILRNENKDNFLGIFFRSRNERDIFLERVVVFDLNDTVVETVFTSGNSVLIDVSQISDDVKYLFLRIISTDRKFKGYLKSIGLIRLRGDFASHKSRVKQWPNPDVS